MKLKTIFTDSTNKEDLKEKVLTWLRADFIAKGSPEAHFWHNSKIIIEQFMDEKALVVVDEQENVLSYLTWTHTPGDTWAEIDIIEVKEEYRRQGLAKKMLNDFCKKFPEIAILTASVIEQSRAFFAKMGWQTHISDEIYRSTKHYKIIDSLQDRTVEPVTTLPREGRFIGIFSKADLPKEQYVDFYFIERNPKKYPIKYFPLELDADNNLTSPIITPFHHKGYIGIYLNGELIKADRARRLFDSRVCHENIEILAITRLNFTYPYIFESSGFLPTAPAEIEEELSDPEDQDDDIKDQDTKRARTTIRPPIGRDSPFHQAKSDSTEREERQQTSLDL